MDRFQAIEHIKILCKVFDEFINCGGFDALESAKEALEFALNDMNVLLEIYSLADMDMLQEMLESE